jgi:hypothetical protein
MERILSDIVNKQLSSKISRGGSCLQVSETNYFASRWHIPLILGTQKTKAEGPQLHGQPRKLRRPCLKIKIMEKMGWGCTSVAEYFSSMNKTIGSIPNNDKKVYT